MLLHLPLRLDFQLIYLAVQIDAILFEQSQVRLQWCEPTIPRHTCDRWRRLIETSPLTGKIVMVRRWDHVCHMQTSL